MEMTSARVLCTSLDELHMKMAAWFRARGLNDNIGVVFHGKSAMGTWYLVRAMGQSKVHEFTVVEKHNVGIRRMVDGEINILQYRTVYEFPKLMQDGYFVIEMVKSLLSQVSGYYINEDDGVVKDLWTWVPKGYTWVGGEELSQKRIATEVSWGELFEYLGKVIRITDIDQYAKAVERFQDKVAGRTSVFGG